MVVFRDNLTHMVVISRLLFKFQSAVRPFFKFILKHHGDHGDHGRFQAKFDPRGRQMVVMVAEPPPPLFRNYLHALYIYFSWLAALNSAATPSWWGGNNDACNL